MPVLPKPKPWLGWQAFLAIVGIAVTACGARSVATSSPANATTPAPVYSPSPSARPDNTITWPAVSATDAASFGIDISGSGPGVASVEIKSRVGTVSLGGATVKTLVYERTPWSDRLLVLYQAVAVQAHAWTVFWFYCSGAALTQVYWESTASAILRKSPMNGTCTSTSASNAHVSWPSGSMAPPTPVPGFLAHGLLLEIGNASPGSVSLQGRTWTLYPYVVVDCWSSCGSPGWYELHSLLRDVKSGAVAFGIVYLYFGQSSRALLSFVVELPTLRRMTDTWFEADWARTS